MKPKVLPVTKSKNPVLELTTLKTKMCFTEEIIYFSIKAEEIIFNSLGVRNFIKNISKFNSNK